MKLTSEHLKSLHELYLVELKKALDMERSITKALPEMAEKANEPELSAAFRQHLAETETHVRRLETILEGHTGSAETKTCKVISSLITEAKDSIKDADAPGILDVTLIASAQQVEHHEMAVYGTLREWAQMMGHTRDVPLLNTTLNEEKAADEKLTNIAHAANAMAA
jgi:ferritin-like metal-binding protein YciE